MEDEVETNIRRNGKVNNKILLAECPEKQKNKIKTTTAV